MELPEIIGSIILLFSTTVILLLTISYDVYKLKNQTRLQPGFNNVQGIRIKSEQIKAAGFGKVQLSEPAFKSIDNKIEFDQPKVTSRFEIVNENLKVDL